MGGVEKERGHITQATQLEFPLTSDIELPDEINPSLEWISKTDPEIVASLWVAQLSKLQKRIKDARPTKNRRGELNPMEIQRGAI